MQENNKYNQKLFYKALNNTRNKNVLKLKQIKDKNEIILTKNVEIIERWGQYFSKLLNGPQRINRK